MRILGWNYRGICNTSTVRALRALIRGNCPQIIFLSETKSDGNRLKKIVVSLGFSEQLIVDAKRRAGGVCMFWSSEISIDILEFNSKMIAVSIYDVVCSWTLVSFYGPPYQSKRFRAWSNLFALLNSISGPWLCFGDFNLVANGDEKEGGRVGSCSTPNFLQELLFDFGAIDLGFLGNKFTWCNNRWGKNCIRERLDRGVANNLWRLAFPRASVLHLGALNYNHTPLVIDTNPPDSFSLRPFRFEAIWTSDPGCYCVIDESWQCNYLGSDCFNLVKKQFHTTQALRKWNKNVFGHCQFHIKELSLKLKAAQGEVTSKVDVFKVASIQNEPNQWLARSETLWKQKSREN